MKRLSDRWMFYCGLLVGMNVSVEDLKHIQDLIDAEEQGLLLRLPCKVGDIVYKICPQSKHIEFGQMWDGKIVKHPCQKCPWQCCDCKDIGFKKDMDNIVQDVVAMNEAWIIARKQYFGSIYFLTKEEAEQMVAVMDDEDILKQSVENTGMEIWGVSEVAGNE